MPVSSEIQTIHIAKAHALKNNNVNQSTKAATDLLNVGNAKAAKAEILGKTSKSVLSEFCVNQLEISVITKKKMGIVRC